MFGLKAQTKSAVAIIISLLNLNIAPVVGCIANGVLSLAVMGIRARSESRPMQAKFPFSQRASSLATNSLFGGDCSSRRPNSTAIDSQNTRVLFPCQDPYLRLGGYIRRCLGFGQHTLVLDLFPNH